MSTPSPTSADAITRHERYVAADPSNALLRRALGDLYHRAGQFEPALACFEKCLELDPADAAARSRIGAVCLSQHRFADAEAALRPLVDAGDDDPALLHNLGIALYYQQRWADAAAVLERARARGLADADNLRYLAYALHGAGETQRAIEACDAWLALAPTQQAAGYRSLLQFEGGDIDAAARAAREVVGADPENSDANLVLGLCATERLEIDDAAGRFERIVRTEPDNARAWLGLALVQMYREQPDAAIASFEQALAIVPNNVGIIVALGWAQFTQKQLVAAEATFRRAIDAERNFAEAHGGLATVLVWQKRWDEARREIALARRLDPNSFGMVYARSVLLAIEGRREQGEHLLAQALERSLRPDGRSIMDNIRIFLRSRGGPPRTASRRLTVRR